MTEPKNFLDKTELAQLKAINARAKQSMQDARESNAQGFDGSGGQVIITYLRDYAGHRAGTSEYMPRIRAEMLLDAGVAMDAGAFQALDEDARPAYCALSTLSRSSKALQTFKM